MKMTISFVSIFLMVFLSPLAFGQEDIKVITSDDGLRTGTITTIPGYNTYYNIWFQSKDGDHHEVCFSCCELGWEVPSCLLFAYDADVLIAQIVRNAKDEVDVYEIDAMRNLKRVGTTRTNGSEISVHDTRGRLVAVIHTNMMAVDYVVDFKSRGIRKEAILFAIPMLRRIEMESLPKVRRKQ